MLTEYTGRTSNQDRTTVIGTVEMRIRTFWVAGISILPAFLLMLITLPLLGVWSALFIPLTIGLALLLIERRSKDGLRLRTYESLRDRTRSSLNEFRFCGEPITVLGGDFAYVRQIALPVAEPEKKTADDDFEGLIK